MINTFDISINKRQVLSSFINSLVCYINESLDLLFESLILKVLRICNEILWWWDFLNVSRSQINLMGTLISQLWTSIEFTTLISMSYLWLGVVSHMSYDMGMSLVNSLVVIGQQRTECDTNEWSHGIIDNDLVIELR